MTVDVFRLHPVKRLSKPTPFGLFVHSHQEKVRFIYFQFTELKVFERVNTCTLLSEREKVQTHHRSSEDALKTKKIIQKKKKVS